MTSKRPREEMSDEPETPDRVIINAGGTRFETSKSTLIGSSSYFKRNFSGRWAALDVTSAAPEVFLDIDHDSFKVLLSCMRRRTALMPTDNADLFRRILLDADFLGCDFLLAEVKETVQRHSGQLPARVEDFDAQHGDVLGAFRSGALPARFFGPPPASTGRDTIHQMIPAGEYDRLDLVSQRSSDGPIVKRVIAYALVEKDSGEQRVEPVIAHHLDEEYHMGSACSLASEFESVLRQHPAEDTSLLALGVSRYPPTTLGNTVRTAFEHTIVEETPHERLGDAISKFGAKGYRAISTWIGKEDRVKILFERAAPQHAAAT